MRHVTLYEWPHTQLCAECVHGWALQHRRDKLGAMAHICRENFEGNEGGSCLKQALSKEAR